MPPSSSVTPSQYFPIPCRCTAKFGNEIALAQHFGSAGSSRDITGTLKGISCASSIAGGPVTESSPWHNHCKIKITSRISNRSASSAQCRHSAIVKDCHCVSWRSQLYLAFFFEQASLGCLCRFPGLPCVLGRWWTELWKIMK